MNRGYIKWWRCAEDDPLHPIHEDRPFTRYEAWEDLVMLANWKTNEWEGMIIARGEYVTSQSKLCSRWRWSRQGLRTFLRGLKRATKVTITTTKTLTKITICNYERYQSDQPSDQPSCQPSTNQELTKSQPRANQELTTTKEGKKVRREEGKKEEKSPARFIPPTIEEIRARISECEFTHTDPERFWNFYESKGWMVGRNKMKSWKSALSGWESRARESAGGNGNPPSKSVERPSNWAPTTQQEDDERREKLRGLSKPL